MEEGTYKEAKFIRNYDRPDIVYSEGIELHKLAYITINSIKPVEGRE